MNRTLKALASVLCALALAGCSTVPITKRKSLNLVSDAQVLSMSQTQYTSFVRKAQGQGVLLQDPRVMDIAHRLIRSADAYMRQHNMHSLRKSMHWEVNVVNNSQVNAFCMPGGKIVVYSGLVRMLGARSVQTDAEIAAVLGHEISHALARHSNERLSNAMLQNMGSNILGTIIGANVPGLERVFNMAYGLGMQAFVALPFGRKQEYEADQMGLVLMALAGYDPRHAVTLWQKMARSSGGGNSNEFLSTHPSEQNRIKAIEAYLPTALQYYKPASTPNTIPASALGRSTTTVPRKR